MRLDLDIDGTLIPVDLVHRTIDLLLRADGTDHVIAGIGQVGDGLWRATVDGVSHDIVLARQGDSFFFRLGERVVSVSVTVPEPGGAAGGAASDQVHASMPGTVVSVAVTAGADVAEGQTLMVIESMKLQTTIAAPRAGTVAEVSHMAGETFNKGDLLVRFVAEDAA